MAQRPAPQRIFCRQGCDKCGKHAWGYRTTQRDGSYLRHCDDCFTRNQGHGKRRRPLLNRLLGRSR